MCCNIYANTNLIVMTDYRAYILDGAGDILLGEELEANNDAAAVTAGWKIVALYVASPDDTLSLAQGVELWDARRLVFSTHPRS
jgi:hypothetical protein